MRRSLLFPLGAFIAVSFLFAETPSPAGHWEGSIQLPGQPLPIELDLGKNAQGWMGTISIPVQNLKGMPLENITVNAESIMVPLPGGQGNPSLSGKLSTDGKTMQGTFTQGPASAPFQLQRTGDAKFEAAAKSTPLSDEFTGHWEGALEANGQTLHLKVNLRKDTNGLGAGNLISVDQGDSVIPISTVTQTGKHLKLEIRPIQGSFQGDLSKDGSELPGQWQQGPGTLPLTLKRVTPPTP